MAQVVQDVEQFMRIYGGIIIIGSFTRQSRGTCEL